MATEQPEQDDKVPTEQDPTESSDERPSEDGATVEEQSEDSFPASDPPSY